MKPAVLEYVRATSIAEATRHLAAHPSAKVVAGGQTLGPMLNLRLAQPSHIVDVTRIPELAQVRESGASVEIGACVTHAAIEDGRTPDPAHGALVHVARGIAYRAVRTRGTIGGSLAHADPSADWLTCLAALDASVSIAGASGTRTVALTSFVIGPLMTALAPGEVLTGVRIAKLPPTARLGYAKLCRKTGEFAHAVGAVVVGRERQSLRVVVGAQASGLIVLDDGWGLLRVQTNGRGAIALDRDALGRRLVAGGVEASEYQVNICVEALERALRQAGSA